jgi:benzoyl-CoA reductase subunit D
MFYTVGIDVGCSAIKTVIMSFDDTGNQETLVASDLRKIRKGNIKEIIRHSYDSILESRGLESADLQYVATTGEGELVDFRRGHFYSMTTHARGALFLNPAARAVVDVGALHAKAMTMDERSKVLDYRMTSQCASGTGQFLENISRYLGVPLNDVGTLSLKADKPEMVSGICAVLAETDVINMVSRNVPISDILKGIHISISKRLINLLRAVKANGTVLISGGLAADVGFIAVMQELADEGKLSVTIASHPQSVFAGAIGAAIWAAFRHVKLQAA